MVARATPALLRCRSGSSASPADDPNRVRCSAMTPPHVTAAAFASWRWWWLASAAVAADDAHRCCFISAARDGSRRFSSIGAPYRPSPSPMLCPAAVTAVTRTTRTVGRRITARARMTQATVSWAHRAARGRPIVAAVAVACSCQLRLARAPSVARMPLLTTTITTVATTAAADAIRTELGRQLGARSASRPPLHHRRNGTASADACRNLPPPPMP